MAALQGRARRGLDAPLPVEEGQRARAVVVRGQTHPRGPRIAVLQDRTHCRYNVPLPVEGRRRAVRVHRRQGAPLRPRTTLWV